MSLDAVSSRADSLADHAELPDKRRRQQLLQDCRELVVTRLTKVVHDALAKMSDELTDLALKSSRREEQQALMDAISIVRQRRNDIELRFRDAFVQCFEQRASVAETNGRTASAGFSGELSLVDDAVITDRLAVDKMVHRARGKLDPDEVLGIRARLAALLDREWFDETRHPAAPEAVFESLKKALSQLAPNADVQSALLDAFEPHVTASLNGVYTSVNERLKANRILPRIRPQVAVQTSGRKPRAGTSEQAAQAAAAHGGSAHGGSAHGGSAHGGSAHGAAAHQGAHGQGATPHAAGGAPSSGHGADAHGDAGVHGFGLEFGDLEASVDAAMRRITEGVPSAHRSAARILTDPDRFGVADLPLPVPQPPLLEALSLIQADMAASAAGAGERGPIAGPAMYAAIAERARDNGSSLDQLTVEIVSLVFDYIYNDRGLADVVKQQLLRLQVVAVKAALIDRSFFARRAHPMRRLIDRISEMASDPDADLAADGSLVRGLTETVEWVLSSFDQDLDTFEEALDRIEALAQAESDRRAARIAEVARRAERDENLADAIEQARGVLQDRVDESTPAFASSFVLDWWSRVMGDLALAEEPGDFRAADAVQIAEALIWSVAPKTAEEVPRLAALLPKLINGLMRGVKRIAMPDADRETFFNELLRAHTRGIEAAKQAQAAKQTVMRAASRIRMRSDGTILFTPPREAPPRVSPDDPMSATPDAALDRLALQRGDFLDLDCDGEGFARYKLAWISPSSKLYIVSRHPEETRTLDRDQLSTLLHQGRARLVDRQATVDEAIDHLTADTTSAGA